MFLAQHEPVGIEQCFLLLKLNQLQPLVVWYRIPLPGGQCNNHKVKNVLSLEMC